MTAVIRKVPVILQLEMVECGAASLAMVMAYHKKWIPLEQLRVDCGVSRDGCTAKGILRVARLYGFEAKGYRVEPDALATLPMPAIIHWEMNHFVVLRGMNKRYAFLADPARGEVKLPLERFRESFTGVALAIAPGESFQPSGKPAGVMAFARERLSGTAPVFAFVLAVSALTSVTGVLATLFNRVFVDDLLSGKHPEWAVPFVLLFLAFHILLIILRGLDTDTSLKITAKFAVISSGMFLWHALRLPVDFYASRSAGDIAARQSENDGVSQSLINLFAPLLIDAAMVVFYLFVVLRYSVPLTLMGFASLGINYFVNRYLAAKSLDIARVGSRDAGKLASMTVSGMELIETIKSAGAEEGFFERWSGLHAAAADSGVKTARLGMTVGLIPPLVSGLANLFVLLTGASLIIRGEMTVGVFFAFQGFLAAFMAPLGKLMNLRTQMQQTKISMERVQDVFNYKPDVEYREFSMNESFYKLSGAVEIKNLTFGYNRLSPPLIEGFNLTVRPGGSVAIVGASGCGKSTVAKLISGLVKPWSGEILFDGKAAGEIPREIFTGSVSVVDQDVTLFQDTVASNIRTWDRSIEDFEVILAARDAGIHPVIIDRDGGYGAEVLEGGKNFSGGERQRLEIAGALAGEPTVLILDEATSALDAKTEHDVIKAIRDRGITTVIIAHRLSTIRECNEIIVLDHGKVVQRGAHDELYAKDGIYRELVSTN